jgi:hypothetical protein
LFWLLKALLGKASKVAGAAKKTDRLALLLNAEGRREKEASRGRVC